MYYQLSFRNYCIKSVLSLYNICLLLNFSSLRQSVGLYSLFETALSRRRSRDLPTTGWRLCAAAAFLHYLFKFALPAAVAQNRLLAAVHFPRMLSLVVSSTLSGCTFRSGRVDYHCRGASLFPAPHRCQVALSNSSRLLFPLHCRSVLAVQVGFSFHVTVRRYSLFWSVIFPRHCRTVLTSRYDCILSRRRQHKVKQSYCCICHLMSGLNSKIFEIIFSLSVSV